MDISSKTPQHDETTTPAETSPPEQPEPAPPTIVATPPPDPSIAALQKAFRAQGATPVRPRALTPTATRPRELAAGAARPRNPAAVGTRPRELTAIKPAKPEMPHASIHARGELETAEGAHVRESMSSEAKITIGRRSRVDGDVRAAAGAEIREEARIEGELDVKGVVQWSPSASATRASINGGLVTDGRVTRVARLVATGGIHPASARPNGGASS